jgi:hypothetical protein
MEHIRRTVSVVISKTRKGIGPKDWGLACRLIGRSYPTRGGVIHTKYHVRSLSTRSLRLKYTSRMKLSDMIEFFLTDV